MTMASPRSRRCLEFGRGNSRALQQAVESPPLHPLEQQPARQKHRQNQHAGPSESRQPLHGPLDFSAKCPAQGHRRARPQRDPGKVRGDKAQGRDLQHSRQRCGDGAQSGNEFGHEQGLYPISLEEALRAVDAGIRRQGKGTEPAQNGPPARPAELVPDSVAPQRREQRTR